MTPHLALRLHAFMYDVSPESFLSLELGDIRLALLNLSSIVTVGKLFGEVEILHASLVDFLSDKQRSTIYYIDKASVCTDFFHRVLEYVKGPDGIRAGNVGLFVGATELCPWIPRGQVRSGVLNFDLYAFINALIRRRYMEQYSLFLGSLSDIFQTWKKLIYAAGLDDEEVLDRPYKYWGSCLAEIYQTDWRLQLLLTLSTSTEHYGHHQVPICRCMDILLEMDDHQLHLVDQHALDLRHASMGPVPVLMGMISRYVDGDAFASAALHCMRFLSHPPKYSDENERPEMDLVYAEWRATCSLTFTLFCEVLQQANTSPELVQFISHHDIHPAVQKRLPASRVTEVNARILAFLSRANLSVNWRIKFTTQRSISIDDQLRPSLDTERPARCFKLQRIDQCCRGIDHGCDC